MKKFYKISALVMMTMLVSCSVKSTSSKITTTTTTSTSPIGTGTGSENGNGTGNGGTSVSGCDGVSRDGATRCYYKNIPTIQVMGATSAATSNGTPYWSSSTITSNGTGISPNQFATDGTFNIRIIPRLANATTAASNPSVAGKTCSPFMNNAKKLYVQIRLRQQGASTGEIATLSAAIDAASNVWHFSPPASATPLVLEVINVMSDIRCNLSGGKYYCPYADIPLNSPTMTYPTECVAFDLQYSTDETYDLPGSPAN